ncbi:MAG: hypothetical protein A2W90_07470 [Bacteroidetes bacterium GWF2_42_66]|nr:MAG: hypothetical protein A2W92_07460 [Bacteroidetes bacterium GWA2_42_15]OFX96928.1 MAG: hypothetical protein A2W89_20170 [Bacteroidetes bacterium GWE2_42_39]OFY44685.1 MAG: hypothetical protein A2W90_07470 [Bacteroidetes bacterium GWF2_42_66]HBL75027.1 response regulator [Prolixibacteraceae bacterium]HCR92165.1 response regulator [Prolixibacteraceae bacterium]
MAFNSFTYDWSDKVILLVEDEPICCLFFQSVFRETESVLLFAYNGEEAVSMIKNHSKIDLVLMDIKLPLMDGLEASRQIKKIRPELPIIVQTAYALNNERQKAMEAGCDDYFTKPIQIEVLMEKIEKIFMTS